MAQARPGAGDALEKGARASSHDASAVVLARPSGVRGDPGPIGMLAFGITTCALMWTVADWANQGWIPAVMCWGVAYGGLCQFIAGFLQIIKGATFAGTAFCSYSSFWIGWAALRFLEATATVPDVAAAARTGDTLWCGLWGVLSLGFFVVTLRKNHCQIVVFATLFITFFLLAGANYSNGARLAAGYTGLLCGASAIYTGFAILFQGELGYSLPGLEPVAYI